MLIKVGGAPRQRVWVGDSLPKSKKTMLIKLFGKEQVQYLLQFRDTYPRKRSVLYASVGSEWHWWLSRGYNDLEFLKLPLQFERVPAGKYWFGPKKIPQIHRGRMEEGRVWYKVKIPPMYPGYGRGIGKSIVTSEVGMVKKRTPVWHHPSWWQKRTLYDHERNPSLCFVAEKGDGYLRDKPGANPELYQREDSMLGLLHGPNVLQSTSGQAGAIRGVKESKEDEGCLQKWSKARCEQAFKASQRARQQASLVTSRRRGVRRPATQRRKGAATNVQLNGGGGSVPKKGIPTQPKGASAGGGG